MNEYVSGKYSDISFTFDYAAYEGALANLSLKQFSQKNLLYHATQMTVSPPEISETKYFSGDDFKYVIEASARLHNLLGKR